MITKFASYRQVPIRADSAACKGLPSAANAILDSRVWKRPAQIAFRPHKPRIAKRDKAARRQESRINLE